MATIYKYNPNGDLFRDGVNVISSVRIGFMDNLLRPGNLAIVTSLGIQNSETVQFFLTFDDVISWFHFGKGMGAMTINGMILTGCNGTPGLYTFLQSTIPSLRGRSVAISVGIAVFACVLTNHNLNFTQDPAPVIEFSLSLNIVDHNLPTFKQVGIGCAFNPSAENNPYTGFNLTGQYSNPGGGNGGWSFTPAVEGSQGGGYWSNTTGNVQGVNYF